MSDYIEAAAGLARLKQRELLLDKLVINVINLLCESHRHHAGGSVGDCKVDTCKEGMALLHEYNHISGNKAGPDV